MPKPSQIRLPGTSPAIQVGWYSSKSCSGVHMWERHFGKAGCRSVCGIASRLTDLRSGFTYRHCKDCQAVYDFERLVNDGTVK